MKRGWESPATLVYLGGFLALVSSFLPWLHGSAFNHSTTITPISTSALRPALILELLVLVGGLGLLAFKGLPTLVGAASGTWLTMSVLFWVFGAKTSMLIPKDALPDGLTLQLDPGATVGLLGGLLCFVGSLVILRDLTWPHSASQLDLVRMVVGVLVAGLLVGAREFAWVQVGSGDWQWRLSVDAVPVIGDAMLLALVAGAVIALLLAVRPSQSVAILGVVVGSGVLVLALIGIIFRGVVTDIAKWTQRRASFLEGHTVSVATRPGPLVDIVAAVALIALAVLVLVRHISGGREEPMPFVAPPSEEPPLTLNW